MDNIPPVPAYIDGRIQCPHSNNDPVPHLLQHLGDEIGCVSEGCGGFQRRYKRPIMLLMPVGQTEFKEFDFPEEIKILNLDGTQFMCRTCLEYRDHHIDKESLRCSTCLSATTKQETRHETRPCQG